MVNRRSVRSQLAVVQCRLRTAVSNVGALWSVLFL